MNENQNQNPDMYFMEIDGERRNLEDRQARTDLENLNIGDAEQIQEVLRISQSTNNRVSGVQTRTLRLEVAMKAINNAFSIESENVRVELFDDANDVVITSGAFDSSNSRLYA